MNLQKKLYIANGRWKDRQHIYVCGYNKTDVINILSELSSSRGMKYEFDNYFSKGVWGNPMDGIAIERGAWVTDKNYGSPKRIYPVGAETIVKIDNYIEDTTLHFHPPCISCIHRNTEIIQDSPCKVCTHYVG